MLDLVRCQCRRGFLLTLGLALFGSSLGSRSANAELIVGLTTDNRIVTFDSSTPGSATAPLAVTGLTAGDTLVGIDRRPTVGPNNGVLYALGVQGTVGRLYTIVQGTGVPTLASTLNVALSGGEFGIDFNPTVDRLRVVSNLDQNLRINVDNGVTIVDTPLAYAVGDPNFNSDPSIVASPTPITSAARPRPSCATWIRTWTSWRLRRPPMMARSTRNSRWG